MSAPNLLELGWLNASIRDIIYKCPTILSQFPVIMITSIDSTNDIARIVKYHDIFSLFPKCKMLGLSLLVPGVDIPDMQKLFHLFNGFDEIWCFEHAPIFAKYSGASLVGPYNVEHDTMRTEVACWMIDSKCSLGLGDGIGLNYVTPCHDISHVLKQTFVE
jgi:hypothetical protein